jgi:cobalt-zinc-cadmium efflux system membrane fusion protein
LNLGKVRTVNVLTNANSAGAADAPSALAEHAAQPASAPRRLLGWIGRTVPVLIVFGALLGLFAWGQHSGWALPKFSSLTGEAGGGKCDWCDEHSVPESQCVECNQSLMPRPISFGWCKQHGVADCPLEHPEVAQVAVRAAVSPADLSRAQRALEFAERPENNSKCKLHERRIQFTSVAAVEKAGVEVEPVWTAPMVEAVGGSGEITYDPTRIGRLSVRAAGSVVRAYKQIGDLVRRGEVVALVDAADVGKAKSDFLQAVAQVRLRSKNAESLLKLARSGAASDYQIQEADSSLSEARIRLAAAQQALTNLGLPLQAGSLDAVPDDRLADYLRFLGIPKPLADSFDAATVTGNLLPVGAPLDGIVVARNVVAGEMVDSTKVLFVVADVSRLWLTLDIGLENAGAVKLGQSVRFHPDGTKVEAAGTVAWVSTEADQKTRTLKVRAALDNSAGKLKANTFGAGRIILREEKQAVVVPNGTVQWEGCCSVVFVRDKDFFKDGAPKVFHVRTVRPGATDEKNTEIAAGLLPGEVVVTKGCAALRAELLKGNLGDGCCCGK